MADFSDDSFQDLLRLMQFLVSINRTLTFNRSSVSTKSVGKQDSPTTVDEQEVAALLAARGENTGRTWSAIEFDGAKTAARASDLLMHSRTTDKATCARMGEILLVRQDRLEAAMGFLKSIGLDSHVRNVAEAPLQEGLAGLLRSAPASAIKNARIEEALEKHPAFALYPHALDHTTTARFQRLLSEDFTAGKAELVHDGEDCYLIVDPSVADRLDAVAEQCMSGGLDLDDPATVRQVSYIKDLLEQNTIPADRAPNDLNALTVRKANELLNEFAPAVDMERRHESRAGRKAPHEQTIFEKRAEAERFEDAGNKLGDTSFVMHEPNAYDPDPSTPYPDIEPKEPGEIEAGQNDLPRDPAADAVFEKGEDVLDFHISRAQEAAAVIDGRDAGRSIERGIPKRDPVR